MKILLILLAILMAGCNAISDSIKGNYDHQMICVNVGDKIVRCENDEVICYYHSAGSMLNCMEKAEAILKKNEKLWGKDK